MLQRTDLTFWNNVDLFYYIILAEGRKNCKGRFRRIMVSMATVKIYADDLKIAKALIDKDERVTRDFFFRQCYPLFKSIYDRFYTDSTCCKEFIDEIYLTIIVPRRSLDGNCYLANYKGESTLATWLKVVCICYCYKKYKIKQRMPVFEAIVNNSEKDCGENGNSDRLESIYGSVEIDFSNLNYHDAEVILSQMPSKRYSRLIRLRYLEEKTNEETAEILGMTMDNYYNKHRLAKEQYIKVYRKEVQL